MGLAGKRRNHGALHGLNPLIIGAWVWLILVEGEKKADGLNPLIIGAWVWRGRGNTWRALTGLNPLIIGAWVWPAKMVGEYVPLLS